MKHARRLAATLAVGTTAATFALVPAAAHAAGASISASLSTPIVDAAKNKTVTLTAHVVDPAGADSVVATWSDSPRTGGWVGLTLASGTKTDGTWTATFAPDTCSTAGYPVAVPGVWNIAVAALSPTRLTDASTSVSALINPDAPDTQAPVGNIFLGKPGTFPNPASVARGSGLEFWSTLQDWAGCGQVSSGTRSVVVTAHPSGATAPVLTVSLHLAVDLTNPLAYGLHWAGTLAIPATAPTGSWVATAVATDNAGNSGPVTVQGGFLVS
jgi:hypothetical protein